MSSVILTAIVAITVATVSTAILVIIAYSLAWLVNQVAEKA